jgi:hypothetical protein
MAARAEISAGLTNSPCSVCSSANKADDIAGSGCVANQRYPTSRTRSFRSRSRLFIRSGVLRSLKEVMSTSAR